MQTTKAHAFLWGDWINWQPKAIFLYFTPQIKTCMKHNDNVNDTHRERRAFENHPHKLGSHSLRVDNITVCLQGFYFINIWCTVRGTFTLFFVYWKRPQDCVYIVAFSSQYVLLLVPDTCMSRSSALEWSVISRLLTTFFCLFYVFRLLNK